MTLKVLIVDDEALARTRLRTLLGDCTAPSAIVVAEAASAVSAIEWLQHHLADLALIDIHLPGVDGLTLAQMLRSLAHPPAVVFVTAYAEHAVQAFELEAVDYLTKPVRLERLQAALQKVARTMHRDPLPESDLPVEVLLIQAHGRAERVLLSEVLYLKAELKYITVRTASKSYLLEGSLSELEAKYAKHFFRIHRNALIARHAVRSLEKQRDPRGGEAWAVRLDGVDELLMVSRRQLSALRELLVNPCS